MARADSALVLFTLSPAKEARRKRLGLGRPERAAAVFASLLQHLESVCSELSGVDLLVATPEECGRRSGRYLRQRGRDFGECLRHAVDDAFELGYRRVVVIGNDAPEISRSYLESAFNALTQTSGKGAVLGPARDGGYVLLGLNGPCREAFESIPWGSSDVASWTRGRLESCGFVVHQLRELSDIDDARGLWRFLTRAQRGTLASLARTLLSTLKPRRASAFPKEILPSAIGLETLPPLRAPPVLV